MPRDKLAPYRAKRDFGKTAEPSGRRPIAQSHRRRFVIQKHAASRLHYDLRLEDHGVFKSWAVTRGPSLDPAQKRLAVEVEDHPLDYGDFEGTIPKGQYGGGTVLLWDRGYWLPVDGVDPQQALEAGQLKFQLAGERLSGQWTLVRMRRDAERAARNNWLLIKHRDAAATSAERAAQLLAEDRSVASGRTMAQIAAGQGSAPRPCMLASRARLRADAVRRSNSAARMPEFVAPELAKLVDRPPGFAGWVHEPKLDGYRIQARIEDGCAVLRTRKGLDWSERFPEIRDQLCRLPACLIDGEIVSLDARGAPSFQALQQALSERHTRQLIYFVFDLLYDQGEDLRSLPLSARKQRLLERLGAAERGRIHYVTHFDAPADSVLQSACRMALEGIVSKRLDAPYVSGRSSGWAKSKCRAGQEVIIGGWTSQGGMLRSLLVGVHRDGRLVYAGSVGTGFGRDAIKPLLPRLKAQAVKESPFAGVRVPRRKGEVHWARPTLVAEIEFTGWTGSGRIRQAAFKGLREDKPASEVTIEMPSSVREAQRAASAAKVPATKASAPSRAGPKSAVAPAMAADRSDARVLGLIISQPDKPLWPDGGNGQPVTKLELARYLEAMGPWIMRHIEGRPCSLLRAPDGIDGPRFLQRHAMAGRSNLLDLMEIPGDREPYVAINRAEGLIAAAQIAALELHPWNCMPHEPSVPGRLVFDLDPAPDVAFSAVVTAALELRARLEAAGLECFCKTTGGKGLHVVTPLARERAPLDWPTAKAFAQALCVRMAADSPQRYLTTMAKKARVGRIFLDYLRNDRVATAVAPLSPRARAWAPISMPLNWSQVSRNLDPQRYTLRTAPALLARSKPWEQYEDAARALRAAIQRLAVPRRAVAARSPARRRATPARRSAARMA